MSPEMFERLAREAGRHEVAAEHRVPPGEHGSFIASTDWVRRFAALVAEECAKECDEEERIRKVAGNAYRTASFAAVAYAAARAAGNCADSIRTTFKPY